MKTSYFHISHLTPTSIFMKLIFSGLLALMLVACSSSSSSSSDSPAKPTITFDFSSSTITVEYEPNLTTKNNINSNINLGQLSYESDTTSVANVDSSGSLSIQGVGTATIKVTRSADNQSTEELTATFLLRVLKGKQLNFAFTQSSLTLTYVADGTISNTATGGTGTGAISYQSDNTGVATVNSTGQITIKGVGTAIITATKEGDSKYNPVSTTYLLTVNKADQTDFRFTTDSITIGIGGKVSNPIKVGAGTGEINYLIDDTKVATINSTNGAVTLKSTGTAIITATKADDANYHPATATYKLTVNDKKNQTGFSFAKDAITLVFGSVTTASNVATGGTGTLSYSIDNTSVATISTASGEVTIKGAGTAKITATRAGDDVYNPISISYILTVKKAEQTGFSFATTSVTLVFGSVVTTSNVAKGGTGTLSYSIDNDNVATISTNTGEVTIKGAGTATITATRTGDNNYNSTATSYLLTIEKADQTGFSFAQNAITITYGEVTKTRNVAMGGQGTGTITYLSKNTKVAPIDGSGTVVIIGAGTAIITAKKGGDANYNPSTISYILTIKKAQQQGFSFIRSTINVTYSEGRTAPSNPTTGGSIIGTTITYSIDNTSVATIDANDGVVTLKSTGTAIITATKAGDDNYLPTSATYVLNVMEPSSSQLSTDLRGIKNIVFTWTSITSTAYYSLESNLGNGGGFVDASTTGFIVVPNSTNIKQTNVRADVALHRYVPLVKGPVYRIEACDAGKVCDSTGVTPSAPLTNAEFNQLIGYIKASNSTANYEFGSAVSLSDDGNTLAVGSPGESNSGAVYVFTRSTVNATWSQQAYIKASNTGNGDQFGNSVSLSDDGNTLAVGARLEGSNSTGVGGADNEGASFSGAVYVFVRDTTWSEQAYIKASNTGFFDEFGRSLSLSGDGNTLAVGARSEGSNSTGVGGIEDNSSATNSGAVYVFTRSNTTWQQQAYIKASNTDNGDQFGYSVSLSDDGNTLAVGAPTEGSNSTGVNGDQDNNDAPGSGAVYVFTRSTVNATWSQQAYIKASNADSGDRFGGIGNAPNQGGPSVSLSGDGNILAVGAYREGSDAKGIDGDQDNNDAGQSGAVYVFTRSSTGMWSQQAYIKASNTDSDDQFGHSVSLSGDGNMLAVGAINEDSPSKGIKKIDGDQEDGVSGFGKAGAVYVFVRSGITWSQQAYVKASNSGDADQFGHSVSLSGDGNTLAVGTENERSNAKGIGGNQDDNSHPSSGAVYLY